MDTLDLYLKYLKEQKQYSDHTIDSYRRDIQMFLEFMNNEGYELKMVDKYLIRSFLRFEVVKGVSKRSNERRIISLRKYYEWLLKNEYVKYNPFIVIKAPKHDATLPSFLHEEELEALIELDAKRDDFLAKRDHAIILLLYASGVRVSELVSLKLQDVIWDKELCELLVKVKKKE